MNHVLKCLIIISIILSSCSDDEPDTIEPTIDVQDNELKKYDIPDRAKPYIDWLILSDNPSRTAAQIDQESAFNTFAQSPYAYGIAQFTESTGVWAASSICKEYGPFQKFGDEWQIKCSIRYMESLQSNNDYGDYCFNRKVAEQEYNGGAWVVWELDYVGNTSLDEAKAVCGVVVLNNGRKRADWACKENYEYPIRISGKQPLFSDLGGYICD